MTNKVEELLKNCTCYFNMLVFNISVNDNGIIAKHNGQEKQIVVYPAMRVEWEGYSKTFIWILKRL